MAKLIFEMSKPGRIAYSLPPCDEAIRDAVCGTGDSLIPGKFRREKDAELPEVSETDVIRHFTELSRMNHGVDNGFYPLGSCTMKYNPKANEDIAALEGFRAVHPYQDDETVQGCIRILYEMDRMLSEITGMDRFSLQPAAGAHGELTGLLIIKAYHAGRGDTGRTKIIVPDRPTERTLHRRRWRALRLSRSSLTKEAG